MKRFWRKTPHFVRKPTVFIVGWVVVLAGIAMLVLPGPGWAAIFVGFAILATEFASAQKIHEWLVARLKTIIDWFKQLWERFRKKR
ncbi:MAG TPA: TIGR02611 family protein [Magnetospirillaceae bacterium]|nr:TIGR02611 family protein [Magnetospirillaceae bacterium]